MNPVLVLVITKETTLQDGLVALLTTISRVSAVLIAEDYLSGLRMMNSHNPHLVVLDLGLPDSGAEKVLAEINEDFSGVKIIALAENSEQHEQAENLNVQTILRKGFHASVLIKITEKLLE